MDFAGIQKLTLLDYPGVTACTVFLRGCNFRCPFCHNASLTAEKSSSDPITESDLLEFLKKRRGLLDGVAITGGEPTLYRELPSFIKKLRDIGYKVKLDTNGTNPDMLLSLIDSGLINYAAMDIKTSPERYSDAAGISADMDLITRSRDILLRGMIPYEFRTTVVKGIHDMDSIIGAAKYIAGASAYYLQKYKDSGDVLSPNGLSAFSDKEMKNFAEAAMRFVPNTQLRGI